MRSGLTRLLLCLVCALGLPGQLFADDFQFERVSLDSGGEFVLLDAHIGYRLNETALEALENGVPLTFVIHIEVREQGAWIWEEDLVELRLRNQVRFHPLSGLYELHDIGNNSRQNFATRNALLSALGEIRALPLVAKAQLQPDTRYNVRIHTYLDIEALPLPLRPLAHVTPSWHLDSDTWEQRLKP